MKRRALFTLLALALLAALPLLALYTSVGARLLLPVAAQLAGLELRYSSGTLAGTLRLDHLRLHRPALRLDLEDVALTHDTRCLWHSAVCLSDLRIGALALVLVGDTAATAAATDGTAAPPGDIRFPMPVDIGSLHLGRAQVQWPGGAWTQDAADLALSLSGDQISVAGATIANAHLELDGTAPPQRPEGRTRLPAIELPLHLRVRSLALATPALTLSGETHALDALSLAGDWARDDLRLSRLSLSSEATGQVDLHDTTLRFTDDWPVRGEALLSAPAAPPWPALGARAAMLTLEGDLADLAVALDAPGEPALRGAGRIDLLAAQPVFEAHLQLDIDAPLEVADLVELPAALRGVALVSPLTVAAHGDTTRQTLSFSGDVRTPHTGVVALSGSARYESGALDVERLTLRRRDSKDELHIAGSAGWRDTLHWSLSLDSPGLTVPALPPRVSARFSGSLATTGSLGPDTWQLAVGDIDLTGQVNGAPARIEGAFTVVDGVPAPDSALRARLPGAALALRPAGADAAVSVLTVEVDEIGTWLADTAGTLQLEARLAGDGRSELRGRLEHLRRGNLQVASGEFDGHYDTADSGGGDFAFRLALREVLARGGRLDEVTVGAAGDAGRLTAQLESLGAIAGRLYLSARRADNGWTGELAPTTVETGGLTWQLDAPVALALDDDDVLHIAAHCWAQTHGRLCSGDWRLAGRGAGSAEFIGDARIVAPWLPVETHLAGPLRGRLALDWDGDGGLAAQLDGEAGPLSLTLDLPQNEQRTAHWQRLVFDARYGAGALDLTATLAEGSRPELQLDVQLPARRDDPLRGTLRVDDLQLAGLAALSGPLGGLGGRLDGNLRLTGTPAQPRLRGGLHLATGELSLPGNPTTLQQLELQLQADGDRATLSGQGLLGGGELAIEGELLTTPEPRLNLSLQGRDNLILYPPATELRASSSLSLTGDARQVAVSGDVTVHAGAFEYTQLPDEGVALSSDVALVDSAGNELATAPPIALVLDVRLRVAEDFRLRGPQLEANLSGELQLRRRAREPLQLFGSLNTAGGHATAFERTLSIKRGTISFTGPPDNPLLDLSAERHISGSDVSAGVRVHGALASDLSLDVYTQPPMSQSEAMSYLIWGHGLDRSTNSDGTVLALALAGSVVNRSSLVSAINKVPGIDNVSFGAEGSEEDAAATVSGYVGERLYLSYGIGLYEPINVLTARFFLQTRLWLEVVSRLENSIDLYYSFDIE